MARTMSVHKEEATFTVRLELVAEFAEDYEGDDDGNAWLARWRAETRPRLLRAVVDALRADRAFDVLPTSRGASPDDEAQFTLTLKTGGVR